MNKKNILSIIKNVRDQFKGASTSDRSLRDLGGEIPISADNMILDDLPILRQRSKILYNNVGIAKSIVETICDFESNYKMVSNIDNDELKAFINNKFKEFSNNVTYNNRTLDEFIKLYKKSMVLNGEAFVKIFDEPRDFTEFTTSFQVLAAERIFTPSDKKREEFNIIDGIQKDEFGREIGFWYLKKELNPYTENHISPYSRNRGQETLSGRTEYNSKDFTYIPFRLDDGTINALHIFNQEYPDQSRGVPYLAPIIKEINNYNSYNTTEWVRRRAASSIGLVISTNEPQANADKLKLNVCDIFDSTSCDSTSSICDSTCGYTIDSSSQYDATLTEYLNSIEDNSRQQVLTPGEIMYLKPGETVSTVNLQGPDAGVYEAFQKNSLINMAGAMKLPFFLFYSDWAQINFSSAKAGLNRYKVTLTDTQNFDNDKLLRPIYINFINELMSRYPEMFETIENMNDIYCYEFFGPVIPDVDLAKETAATVEMLNNKLTSRTEYFSSRGMNFEDQMKLIANEEKYIQSLGLNISSDPSYNDKIQTMEEPTQTNVSIPKANINQ